MGPLGVGVTAKANWALNCMYACMHDRVKGDGVGMHLGKAMPMKADRRQVDRGRVIAMVQWEGELMDAMRVDFERMLNWDTVRDTLRWRTR